MLGTLPSHRSEVLPYYGECLLRASLGHVRHLVEAQPVTQRQQIGGHGAKGAHEPLDRAILFAQQHAGHDRLFVNVQATTAWIEYLHSGCSSLGSPREVRGKHQFRLRAHRTLGATVIHTGTHQDQLPNRAQCTKMPRSRLAGFPTQYATFSSASLSATDIALPNSNPWGKLILDEASSLAQEISS
jgi:hypothetical protein